jgi:hypothetical protein
VPPLDLISQFISLVKRPDAVSPDYLYAFTTGPRAELDVTEGLFARAWKVRCSNALKKIYVAVSNEANDEWEAEQELLTFTGDDFSEVDIAFDQQGQVVVCGVRGGNQIWLYYYETLISDYQFIQIATGRTPRVALDEPFDAAISDVLVSYVKSDDSAIVYRQQRDRYLVEYSTGYAATANSFVEDCGWTIDHRFLILVSERNTVTGRYGLLKIYSALYPIRGYDTEGLAPGATLRDSTLVTVIISVGGDPESGEPSSYVFQLAPTGQLIEGDLRDVYLYVGNTDDGDPLNDYFSDAPILAPQTTLISGNLEVIVGAVIEQMAYLDKPNLAPTAQLQASDLTVIVIEHTGYDKPNLAPSATIQSGDLTVP